jgi:hypothetical protein
VSSSLGLKVRRRFTVEEQALVIFLRFGSLNSDEKVWMTFTDIWKKTGVKIQSQFAIINRWRKRGFVIYNAMKKRRQSKLD